MNDKTKSGRVKLILFLLVAVAFVALARYYRVDLLLQETVDWISGQGAVGAAAFIAIYIAACVFLVPGSVLTLGAGVVWGVVGGTAMVSVASTLGATAAFLTGRYLARGWITAKIEGNRKFSAIDEAVGREGWKIVGLTRLSPVFPFNLLNYAFGLTRVSLKHYFFASWIGMFPGTVMYVYLGAVAGDLATLGAGGAQKTPAEWTMMVVGLVATVAVTLYVTRIAKAALSASVKELD
jgi:uncharacterized membrane protein YdjX (TVP38/TMEM64 family)